MVELVNMVVFAKCGSFLFQLRIDIKFVLQKRSINGLTVKPMRNIRPSALIKKFDDAQDTVKDEAIIRKGTPGIQEIGAGLWR